MLRSLIEFYSVLLLYCVRMCVSLYSIGRIERHWYAFNVVFGYGCYVFTVYLCVAVVIVVSVLFRIFVLCVVGASSVSHVCRFLILSSAFVATDLRPFNVDWFSPNYVFALCQSSRFVYTFTIWLLAVFSCASPHTHTHAHSHKLSHHVSISARHSLTPFIHPRMVFQIGISLSCNTFVCMCRRNRIWMRFRVNCAYR